MLAKNCLFYIIKKIIIINSLLWVAVELFSMDMLSKFYKNMLNNDKKVMSIWEMSGKNVTSMLLW